ncbi:CaiB/BaiF CoA transferase family protein [Rhodococcus indonesiensis]|uniref:CaiB/BaiF CoA transferase family protein n=1 Tax=Rhodococcus indonesiensis TaxID=3055869 RepID=UPI0039F67CE3
MPSLPLRGVRVLDLSTVLAAPVTATLLGDFGAEVVKVEEPGRGDFTRGRAAEPGGRSLQWLQEGRNKKSITLDLRRSRGRELLRRLIPNFDIVVTNYRPPTMERWGLAPDDLRALHPAGIFVFITGYGLTGPYRDRGSFDRIASAYSGLTYVSGEPDRPPVRSGFSVIDFMSAYLSAFAAMVALREREVNGGEGQIVDLALYEAGFRAAEDAYLAYSAHGEIRERLGNKNPYIVPASDFSTQDNRIVSLHAGTDTLFARLCDVMGQPRLAQDPRFHTRHARSANQDALYALIEEWTATYSADDVVKLLTDAGVPASPVMSMADIAVDPHYRDRGTLVAVDDEEFGAVDMVAPLPHLSGTPGRIRSLGPRLGQHTDEILSRELGVSDDELQRLRADHTI